MPIDVQMPDGTIISGVPDNITQADLLARYKSFAAKADKSGAVPDELGRFDAAKQNAPASAGFSARDTALALGQGVVGAGKSLADVFGADNAASRSLGEVQKDISELYTPERKAEMARREQLQKQASKGTIGEEIGTFLAGVAEAPVQSLAQGLGSIVPYVGTGIIGGIAKLGGATVKAINTVVGAAQGAGAVKGSLYDSVKAELEKSGMSEKEAAVKASKAQEYLGENFLDIAGGTLLGGAAARVGVENLLTPGAAAKLDKRLLTRAGKAALAEAPLEGAQGSQEQLAINRALQKQGFDVGTFEGVAGAGARDAAIGALTGSTVGAVRAPSAEKVVTPPEDTAVPPADTGVTPPVDSTAPRAAPPSSAQDTQAMIDEISGVPPVAPPTDTTLPPESAVPQTEEERNKAIEISNGIAATGYVNGILERAQQGFVRAGQEYEETGSSPSMPKVVDFLRGQLRPLMGSEKADRYIQYLTEEGGLASIENAVNNEYFGDAVNGVSNIVKPISIGTKPPVEPTAPLEPAATGEPISETPPPEVNVPKEPVSKTPTPEQPKMVEDETGEKLSYPMFVDMADKGYKLYSFENPRTYENKGGVRYRTLEKDGVRLAFEPQQVLFTDPKKPNQQPQLGMGNEKDVAFHFLGVDPDVRKQGKARQALQDLVEIADKNGLTLYGEPAQLEKGGMTSDQLLSFYKQFGFEPTNDTNKVIVREPSAKAKAEQTAPDVELIANETTPEVKDFDIAKSKETIHDEIKGLDAEQLSQYLVDNAPNSAARHIANKILTRVKDLVKAGIPVKITIQDGPVVYKDADDIKGNEQSATAYGWQQPILDEKTKKLVYYAITLNGLDKNGKEHRSTGTNYQTIMHEMLHMVTSMQLHLMKNRGFKGDKQVYRDLMSVKRAVVEKLIEERAKPPDERSSIIKRLEAALDVTGYKNGKPTFGPSTLDELISHGLTDKRLQKYLSTIEMGKKTALQELMAIFRKLVGIDPQYETALDRLILGSNTLLDQKPSDINRMLKGFGYTAGKLKSARTQSTVVDGGTDKPAAEARNYLGKPVEASWAFPEDRFVKVPGAPEQSIDKLLYIFQDKQIDLKRAQEGIAKAAGEITDNINAYDKEQLFHGKVATGIRNFLLNELMPAIKKIKESKLTTKDMQDYLLARHAEERNDRMNELNKLDPRTGEPRKTPWELQDRASGMSTDDAREYLKNLDPTKKKSLETIGEMFDKMITGTQQILVESGSESQATIDAWNEAYEHYMPLFRVEEDFNNGGNRSGLNKGFNVNNPFSKRAMGSAKEVQNIVTNLIKQRERALIRAEKLTVTKALYGLFLMNPNPDIALPVNPDAIKSKDALIAELKGLGYENAEEIANNLMEEPKSRYISKNRVIDKDTGLPTSDTEESVKLRIDSLARFGDNVLTLRVDGKNRYIFFNQDNPNAVRMAASLKSLDTESLGSVMSIVAKGTRWFANVNTQYNPIFAAVNLIRDIGSAQFNLTTTPLAGKQAQVTAGIFPAMRGIFKILRAERSGEVGGNSEMEKAFREFREAGGQTGYRDALARKESEQSIVDDMLKQKSLSGNALQAMKSVFGALSDFNDTLENSIRLSAYIQASKPKSEGGLGLSKQQAAVIAKNLTVNFDKKGQISANVNALYAFFNASVQGTARLATTLTGPKGKAIIGGGILAGSMQSLLLAAAGFREDEPPEFVKQRNFIIPTPDGNYLTIPYPLGFNLLPNIGRITTEFMISGGKNPAKRAGDLLGATADAFSPIGSSGLSMQTIAPTVLDPLAALEANKDAFGRPIYKEDRATNPTPGYLRSRENASEMNKAIAYFFNVASGGTKYSKGFFSPTADELDYVVGQVTGGLGREIMKTGQTIKAAGTGEDLPAYRVPLLGRFYGETESNAAESQRFYNNITRMADHENEIKGRIKNKESVASYYRDNPEARLYQQANTIENQINALNKQKKEFIEKDLPKDRIKRIENQKALIMKRFNDQLAKFED
jgi:GNAT superfamily N-acetyltransferase